MPRPQVQHIEDSVKKTTDAVGIPSTVISMQGYGMMSGKRVLETTQGLMGDEQSK